MYATIWCAKISTVADDYVSTAVWSTGIFRDDNYLNRVRQVQTIRKNLAMGKAHAAAVRLVDVVINRSLVPQIFSRVNSQKNSRRIM